MTTDIVASSFFDRPVQVVARDLIGRTLVVRNPMNSIRAVIVETEAYGGPGDLASHAAFRSGGRAAIMAGSPGLVYVYAAYGMYPCFNIVTGPEGLPSAVLLRGVWACGDDGPTIGPGRTTRRLCIKLADHGERIPGDRFEVIASQHFNSATATRRIGITRATETKWRFVAELEN